MMYYQFRSFVDGLLVFTLASCRQENTRGGEEPGEVRQEEPSKPQIQSASKLCLSWCMQSTEAPKEKCLTCTKVGYRLENFGPQVLSC